MLQRSRIVGPGGGSQRSRIVGVVVVRRDRELRGLVLAQWLNVGGSS